MRKLALPAGFGLLLLMAPPASGQGLDIGRPVPEFALTDLAGNTHRLSDYRRKAVFLNFWATWCVPCRIDRRGRLVAREPGPRGWDGGEARVKLETLLR